MLARRPVAAAAAAALVSFAPLASAQSSVTLYGVLDTFVGYIENNSPTAGKASAGVVNTGGLQTSFFGIRGSEDLGGGLRAIFAIESFFQPDVGDSGRFRTDTFWARSAFVGLESGSFGRITLGRNTAPYFISTLLFNPLVDSFVVGPMITHTFRGALQGDTGLSNSVRWTSPSWGGLRADVLYSLGAEDLTGGPDKNAGKAIDAALVFFRGAFGATVAYRQIDLSAGGNGREQEAWQLGASYDLKFLKAFAQYQQIKETFALAASNIDRDTIQAGVSVPVGAGSILASYTTSDIKDVSPATPSKRDTWALAYVHTLSKRTDLYGAYYSDVFKSPDGAEQTVVALGVRHRF
ncbi:MAG: porin [Burkholderiales bacterium]|jgi:predicted porin